MCRDYKETLEVVCEKGSRDKYGLLNWTVAQDTDDIVYYQSYTHEVNTLNKMSLILWWPCDTPCWK